MRAANAALLVKGGVRTRAGPNPAELDKENKPGAEAVPEVQEPILEPTEAAVGEAWVEELERQMRIVGQV